MDALEMLCGRRSIRKYRPEQVDAGLLSEVMKAGTYAPTAMGRQSPVIIAVRDPGDRAAVSALNARVMGKDGIDPYYGAPTVLLVLATEDAATEEIGILDCAAVCTNMLNAAYAVGLGSCWINRCKQMFEFPEGKALLRKWELSENLRGVASMALGYADCETPAPAPRKENYTLTV